MAFHHRLPYGMGELHKNLIRLARAQHMPTMLSGIRFSLNRKVYQRPREN